MDIFAHHSVTQPSMSETFCWRKTFALSKQNFTVYRSGQKATILINHLTFPRVWMDSMLEWEQKKFENGSQLQANDDDAMPP